MELNVDVLVIGAGQAGLAMGHYLSKHQPSLTFAIIDRGSQIGEVWRNRYDSLILFTPRWFSSLPGLDLQGFSSGYATKDEIADYLLTYAGTFQLPVHLQTEVLRLEKTPDGFKALTSRGIYLAKKVIVSTGPFQKPFIPSMANSLSNDVYQVHTSSYLNPKQLKEGNVLVVGAGNSGAQIAVELSKTRDVLISMGHQPKFMPVELAGKSIFWWFHKSGVMKATISSPFGRWLSKQPDPIFGKELKILSDRRVILTKPRAVKAAGRTIWFQDQSELKVDNVIWGTGFISDYGWIHIPGVVQPSGKPVHRRGVSPIEGLFFLGLPWQNRRGSALIGGVGEDARFLYEYVARGQDQLVF
ncbi:NAD(P)/FAD-dependent oxidoreductase [Paenibacillus sp. GYB004]